ncbi:MAG TPA: type II toxin-antitoxin system prevent-host-death family antitoxin [Verrucomicrobiales bacterium]|nr:type II toxin-antitoxin system prevent-host-death family antitoxin [Verrucomicrobiales bacterium]
MSQINMFEAKTHLSSYVQRALEGEEVIIAKAGKPMVRPEPIVSKKRRLGGWEGKVRMVADFDDCSSELETLFGMQSGK